MNTNKQNIKREQSAMAVVLCNGKILCIVEEIYGKPVLSLPKGHVEGSESVIETAIRECFEETDVILSTKDVVRLLENYSYSFSTPDGQQICKTLCPVLFYLSQEQTPRAKEKRILQAKFVDIDSFLRDCFYDNIVSLVKNI